jgi:hypothetical protein
LNKLYGIEVGHSDPARQTLCYDGTYNSRTPRMGVVRMTWTQRRRFVSNQVIPPDLEAACLDEIYAAGSMGSHRDATFVYLDYVVDHPLSQGAYMGILRVMWAW